MLRNSKHYLHVKREIWDQNSENFQQFVTAIVLRIRLSTGIFCRIQTPGNIITATTSIIERQSHDITATSLFPERQSHDDGIPGVLI